MYVFNIALLETATGTLNTVANFEIRPEIKLTRDLHHYYFKSLTKKNFYEKSTFAGDMQRFGTLWSMLYILQARPGL